MVKWWMRLVYPFSRVRFTGRRGAGQEVDQREPGETSRKQSISLLIRPSYFYIFFVILFPLSCEPGESVFHAGYGHS